METKVCANLVIGNKIQSVNLAYVPKVNEILTFENKDYIVKDVNDLADTIRKAFIIAKKGRPGPVLIDIPAFIGEVAKGDIKKAYEILSQQTSLPAVCGRVCPQENQCQGVCTRCAKGEPVAIGRLERFVADFHNENLLQLLFLFVYFLLY